MNADQKQQAKALIAANAENIEDELADAMSALLQELIDAPEPELFGYFNEAAPFGWTDCSETDEGAIALYTAPPAPAPSVPDEFYNAVANLSVELEELVAETSGVYGLHLNGDPSPWGEILEGGRFERISSLHVVQNLLAARPPEQPADLVRDAERYRWLRNWTRRAYGIDSNPAFILPHVPIPTGPDQNIMRGSLAQHLDNAIDAAIERDKKGDQS